jgi:hypothetical protein
MAVYGSVRHPKNIRGPYNIFFGDGPVHILPYDPKLFAILYFLSKIIMQVPGRSIY